jgi:hypothetical protein
MSHRQWYGSRLRVDTARHRLLVCGVATASLVLAIAVAAFAATGVRIKSSFWEIGINNGPSHKVAAGRRFTFCGAETVGVIEAKVTLRSPIPSGEDFGYGLDGPRSAGNSLFTNAGPSDGRGTVIAPAQIPLSFPKLKARNAIGFPPGSYRFVLKVAGHQAFTQRVALVHRAAC